MEITYEDYYQLKCRVTELERQMKEQSKAAEQPSSKRIISLAKEVNEMPIHHLWVGKNDERLTAQYIKNGNSEVWLSFFKLALAIHTKAHDYAKGYSRKDGSVITVPIERTGLEPTKLSELSQAQLQVSLDMLNELIPIYNRYFKEQQRGVTVTELNGSVSFVPAKE